MKLFGRKKKDSTDVLRAALGDVEPPAFPTAVMRLLQLLRDPDTELGAIAEGLECDPTLVLRVLRTVNSAAYGAQRPIDSVHHAVSMMGRSKVEQLVLGLAVKGSLPSAPAPGFDSERFWQASFFRASLARCLASELHPAEEARCFTAGLLQDMAVPLIAHSRPADYGRVLEEWHASANAQLHRLEKDALGWSHDEVGGALAVEWALPESLSRLIGSHHHDEVTDQELPPALRLVALHRETECEHGLEALIERGRDDYGLPPEGVREAIATCSEQARELADLLA